MAHSPLPAVLALSDGRVFHGEGFGACSTTTGEVCFNTSMTGYQEILTDPSYRGQIVAMTYPEIGNTGVNFIDEESNQPQVRGFVVANLSPVVSSWRATQTLDDYLRERGIPAVQGIDTRALTRHLRERGAMQGCLSIGELSPEEAVARARASAPMEGSDFVQEVTPSEASAWDVENRESRAWQVAQTGEQEGRAQEQQGDWFATLQPARWRLAVLDFGMKKNIARRLRQEGFAVELLPSTTSAEEILARQPDGLFLSNGPGDPATLTYAHETVRGLIGKLPIFGICLGHQIIALALGGKTFKLKFGHRGANQPVQDHRTGSVAITSQNHGFAVDPASLPAEVEVTHLNLNDHTVAGLRHRQHPVCSVQYHPEASPGPHDAEDFFVEFAKMVEQSSTVG
jgi:carbamoyl-phosphate synthase small subunit